MPARHLHIPPTQLLAGLAFLATACMPLLLAQAGGDDEALAAQRKLALANWKRIYPEQDPPHHETANLLLYGKVPGKTLKDVGASLEKQMALAKKVLNVDKGDLWPGKLTVYLVAEKGDYGTFIRRVDKRRPEEGETGSASIRKDQPHVIAGAPRGPLDPPVDGQAGAQIAVALLVKKAGTGVPDWVRTGFARATWLQGLSTLERAQEHRRALALVGQRKRTAQSAWGVLDDDEAPVLRGSVIEYLAYSGRTAKFLPFVMAFRPDDTKAEPTTADALKAADITPANLNTVWQKWLKTAR
jgi:hypothetical protein